MSFICIAYTARRRTVTAGGRGKLGASYMNTEEAQPVTVTSETTGDGIDPPYYHPAYASTVYRSPKRPLISVAEGASELTEPVYGHQPVGESTPAPPRQHPEEPQGQRIFVSGRLLDSDGRPIPGTLVEVWQANA